MSKQYFSERLEIFAVIYGTLLKNENKITLSRVNKLITEKVGFERIKNDEMQEIYDEISTDKELDKIFTDTVKGIYTLENIQDYKGEQAFDTNNYLDTVTPYLVAKESRLAENREFNKIMRDGTYLKILVDNLKNDLVDEFKDFKVYKEHAEYDEYVDLFVAKSEKTMVLALSDFHVGFSFNNYVSGGYNFEILKERLEIYFKEAERLAKEHGVTDFRIYFVGDLIEHINMRNVNQAFETELTLSEQIAKGTRLLADIINRFENLGKVKFAMVHGNHDRMQGNKNDKVHNDSAIYIALDQLLFLQECGAFKNTEIVDNRKDIYNARDDIHGYLIHLNHGDGLANRKPIISKFEHDREINMLIKGHVHHFYILQEDYKRMHVTNSSPIGYNNYSDEKALGKTSPSQTIMLFDHKDLYNPLIKPVFLEKKWGI
ncbi:exonuclease [Staphylococcus phage PG-2021_40]